jgi:hypothetical protein
MGEMSRRDLQSILDNSTLVIQVKDAGGRYVRINCRFEGPIGSAPMTWR